MNVAFILTLTLCSLSAIAVRLLCIALAMRVSLCAILGSGKACEI